MLSTPLLSEPRGSRSFTPALACRVFFFSFLIYIWCFCEGFFLNFLFKSCLERNEEPEMQHCYSLSKFHYFTQTNNWLLIKGCWLKVCSVSAVVTYSFCTFKCTIHLYLLPAVENLHLVSRVYIIILLESLAKPPSQQRNLAQNFHWTKMKHSKEQIRIGRDKAATSV